jgi:hypothetical protein
MTLERRVERFQARAQQEINLADDKIDRYREYLSVRQAEIVEVEDQLRRFANERNQILSQQAGIQKHLSVAKQARISQLRSEHENAISALVKQQEEDITALTRNFQSMLDLRNANAQTNSNKKQNGIRRSIEEAKSTIGKLQRHITEINTVFDTDLEEDAAEKHRLEAERIRYLEEAVKEHESYRLECLLQGQDKLAECVRTLEGMGEAHGIRLDKLQTRLEDMDDNHERKLQEVSSKSSGEIRTLKRRIKEEELKTQRLQKAVKKAEERHRLEIEGMELENNRLRGAYSELLGTLKQIPAPQVEKKVNESEAIEAVRLRKELGARELVLAREREMNTSLKREIAQCVHDKKVAQRRAALNLAPQEF